MDLLEKKRLVVFFLALLFIFFGNISSDQKLESIKAYPVKELKYFTLGYTNAMADSFWLRVNQDFDYCENGDQERSYNSGKNLGDILTSKQSSSRCHKGWVFQILDFISDLVPKFQEVYIQGGPILNVAVDDREGAKIIYDKGLKIFPKNWTLNYRAAYHYLFEERDAQRAAELLRVAYENGGPEPLLSLSARLYSKVGQNLFAKAILEEFIENHPDSPKIPEIQERLRELRKNQ